MQLCTDLHFLFQEYLTTLVYGLNMYACLLDDAPQCMFESDCLFALSCNAFNFSAQKK